MLLLIHSTIEKNKNDYQKMHTVPLEERSSIIIVRGKKLNETSMILSVLAIILSVIAIIISIITLYRDTQLGCYLGIHKYQQEFQDHILFLSLV